MNKELIFKLLDLNAIKTASEKYRISIYTSTENNYLVLYLYTAAPVALREEIFELCVEKKRDSDNYYMKYWTCKYPTWSQEISITKSEFEKVKLNFLIAKDYIGSLQDEDVSNIIKEIINDPF